MRFRLWKKGIIPEDGDVLIRVKETDEGIDIDLVNVDGIPYWYVGELDNEERGLVLFSHIGDRNIAVDEGGHLAVRITPVII